MADQTRTRWAIGFALTVLLAMASSGTYAIRWAGRMESELAGIRESASKMHTVRDRFYETEGIVKADTARLDKLETIVRESRDFRETYIQRVESRLARIETLLDQIAKKP